MSGAAIEARDLAFRRPGGFELRVPELALEAGARVACVGPSGCGKSTLLGLLGGLLVPSAGALEVDGVDLPRAGDAERRRFRLTRVGLVFQELELVEHLTVRDNALLPWSLGAREAAAALDARGAELGRLARELGIERLLDRLPRDLSQGERQRFALCRALVGTPRLVLADEPTGNLDDRSARRAVELTLAEAERLGATLLLVTHERDLLDAFDRVVDVEPWGRHVAWTRRSASPGATSPTTGGGAS